jgi:hypothetical protein
MLFSRTSSLSTVASTCSVISSLTPFKNATATKATTTNGMILAHASLYAAAYSSWLASFVAPRIWSLIPGTASNPAPLAKAARRAGTEDGGRPRLVATLLIPELYVEASLLL